MCWHVCGVCMWGLVDECVCDADGGGSLSGVRLLNNLVAVGKNKRPRYGNEVN